MIKFDFVLSDEDASNLIDILNNAAAHALFCGVEDPINITYYREHSAYIKSIIKKVLDGNVRI